jgi:hypothetical protein
MAHFFGVEPSIESHSGAMDALARCIMCLDDFKSLEHQPCACSTACPNNHLICRGCLDRLIISHCRTVLRTPSTPSNINCPACKVGQGPFDFRFGFRGILQSGHKHEIQPYTDDQLKRAASKDALKMLNAVAEADQKLAALPEHEQIVKGNTDCYKCPKCEFGPVAHRACSSLNTHHGMQGISNKCPKCDFLASDISEWVRVSAAPTLPSECLEELALSQRTPLAIWITDRESHSCDGWPDRLYSRPLVFSHAYDLPSETSTIGLSLPWPTPIPWHRRLHAFTTCPDLKDLIECNKSENFHPRGRPKKRQDRIPRFAPRNSHMGR